MMKINHVITNTSSCPFENKHVIKLIQKYIRKCSDRLGYDGAGLSGIDPFARESFTTQTDWFLTNDLNEAMPTDYHMEANDFCEMLLKRYGTPGPEDDNLDFDICLFDPPYTLRMLKDHYDGVGMDLELWQTHNMWGRAKDAISRLIGVGGYVISFGYSTRGMGKHRGFEKKEILILESGGKPDRYDILMTVEQKIQHTLQEFSEEE